MPKQGRATAKAVADPDRTGLVVIVSSRAEVLEVGGWKFKFKF